MATSETWLLINGSPRADGRCARIETMLTTAYSFKNPEVVLQTYHVATTEVAGCDGCEQCKEHGQCVHRDAMDGLLEQLEQVTRLIVVAPVYFAGLPSQTKAVLDRLQPLYWRWLERKQAGIPAKPKRPLYLFVAGQGGDPHGYEPLVVQVRSAFALAGFAIEDVVSVTDMYTYERTFITDGHESFHANKLGDSRG